MTDTNILRAKRLALHMTLAEVGEFVGLTASRISALEHITLPDQRARVGALYIKRLAVLYAMGELEVKRVCRGLPAIEDHVEHRMFTPLTAEGENGIM